MTYQLRYDRHFSRLMAALPGDMRAVARQTIKDLARDPRPISAKELDEYPDHWRIWLLRNHRLIWHVLEDEQVVDLMYVGPKPPDLYEQLGLSKRLREAEEALAYEVGLDRDEVVKKMKNKFTAVFEQEGEWWIGYVEELPGANTQGATLPEARENLKAAIQLVLEANRELTRREVEGKTSIREDILVTV
jgi:predicted RNase H-like HicB family nuclease/mRNA-degrading endonuclease RelE of RelBE toxin-antitoxin system